MLKLYGSTTSPFVRRIRILLADKAHEYINMQIFEGPDRQVLRELNPTLKIPMLDDGGQIIFDSRVIFRYLTEKFALGSLSWAQENQLTLIDSVNDALVHKLLTQRSQVEADPQKLIFRLQQERIETVLQALEAQLTSGQFGDWGYPEICLYSMLDWALFRELHSLQAYPALRAFHAKHNNKAEVQATDPRE
ncbi:hypothetical protein GCM10009092_30230 [Bowmanella denitrificans]|uniref:GST N-terminal domain-containing protein n=1 Tax=Bowmanella denitrificans TaxID=366582 RepID=A0ABN0XH61_9ALTE